MPTEFEFSEKSGGGVKEETDEEGEDEAEEDETEEDETEEDEAEFGLAAGKSDAGFSLFCHG
ncbi:hypothetical protein MsAm2_10320 [Methanolapillus ohkumae]|uniref:Uncharacterized protein n=1 Tax=Methanolapillus ohkumae TaxID=3028298 RepID=A0AA96V7U1_9EURY|nr:hypothetical protein MsAm2_10320 [Methanosarcinaceae archaeon Am2]